MIAAPTAARSKFYELSVASVERLCDDAAAVTFAVPAELAEDFAFRPGQYLTVRRNVSGLEHRRSYSISSAAGQAPRIGVREVSGGAVSSWLVHEVRAGDRVEVQPPQGNFCPQTDVPGRHVLIAAGSGITPVLSIAASVLADGQSSVILIYGNRRGDSVMFADDVADLKNAYMGRVRLVHVFSREAQEAELLCGRLDATRLAKLIPAVVEAADVDHWWLCGPYGMVVDAGKVIADLGVGPERVHRELFYVEDLPPEPIHRPDVAAEGARVTAVMDGRAAASTVAWDVTVLDGLQPTRPDLPFACKGGVCGTCRAKVVAGEVRMRRNFALEPSEVEAGYVLTCQSLCISEEVTVDYDA